MNHTRLYNKCEAKQESRSLLLSTYKKLFETDRLLPNTQFYSLCARCWDSGIIKDSEYDYLVNKSKFLSPRQYYGIDINNEVIDHNKNLKDANWINKDLIAYCQQVDDFRPSIINFDSIQICKTLQPKLITLLKCCKELKNILIYVNFVTSSRFYNTTGDKTQFMFNINEHLKDEIDPNLVNAIIDNNYKVDKSIYSYNSGYTVMSGTFIYKKTFISSTQRRFSLTT